MSVIEKSMYILDLKDDFDGEGSPAYTRETLEEAHMLYKALAYVIDKTDAVITHSENGSIDILWKLSDGKLLVNVKKDEAERPTYFVSGSVKRGIDVFFHMCHQYPKPQ
jgi:hypothetical protein